jgi:putative cell wall-binding protein
VVILFCAGAYIQPFPVAAAETSDITSIEFVSEDDCNLLTGESSTIRFRVFDKNHALYSSQLTGYLWNTTVGGTIPLTLSGSGTYTASDVTIDQAGTYALYISDFQSNKAVSSSNITVRDPLVQLSGEFSVNLNQTITAHLTDTDGKPLNKKSITVDGTDAGASVQNYTTLNDGSFTISLTPAQIGQIKFIFGTAVIKTVLVTDQNVALEVSGNLVLNAKSYLVIRLSDAEGQPLANKSFSVDAAEAGLSTSSYTTLNDGSATINLTPSRIGEVYFIFGGRVLQSQRVQPGYVQGDRIGADAADNVALSAEIARSGWTSAQNAILTRDDVVADAMVAVPLSKKLDAPILMTPPQALSADVFLELQRLGVQRVFIIGGEGAVSAFTEDYLKLNGIAVTRFAGADRYDTAAQVAAWLGSVSTAYLAYGYGEPDALAASAFAAQQGAPILLTESRQLPEATRQALQGLGVAQVKLLGGNGVISTELEQQLSGQYQVTRYGGADRYATETAIFQGEFKNQTPLYFTSAFVASSDVSSGTPYGDALLTAALAAKTQGFVITVPPNSLPDTVRYFLLYNKGYIPSALIVGNQNAISTSLETQIHELLTH